ncbi:NIPSNAP family protein [Xanthomonas campestris]|uniref:NIPSNAP family protein n=1 Tax=Xanthomonas campestris TaxID=339 RepID=UPI002163FCAE|nr:NIPSNAP family protein [Xanthomonas campestris]MEA9574840.1 NIPSNAP family protein [Xanthomonas campestris]MEB2109901.1 NIPSNAP family protein [Xanthomonas campestris pv. campestris]
MLAPLAAGPCSMISCSLRYVIAPYLLAEFEQYARLWIPLVTRCGGQHHGDLLPSEGRTTASLAAYERYRSASLEDAECLAAFAYAEHTRCIISDERSFFRPLPG